MAPIRVTMNQQGRIVIPAAARRHLGLTGGETLILSLEDEAMRLATPMANLRRMQQVIAERHGDDTRRWSDEFIAWKRAEAEREAHSLEG